MPATLQPPFQDHEPRNMLHGISWRTYEQMLNDIGEQPGLRMTYDRGSLEIMTTSSLHEILKKLLGRLIEMLCFQLSIPHKCGGSFTHKREDLLKGIEPDECYWIQNESAVRGKESIDLSIDPPPDLALEIDVTRSWLDRMTIYAALGIPEVWRYNRRTLRVYLLQSNGGYAESDTGAAFAFLPMAEFARFLHINESSDELTQMQAFVDWLREQDFSTR
jgi:Uma2 family endonuclease